MARQVPREPRTENPARDRSPLLQRPVSKWVSGATLIAILLGVAWLYRSVRVGEITSDSMAPTLSRGDWYLIRIDAYREATPERGDIVVIKHPEGKEMLVKRVVGVAGENVGVVFGRVIVNGALLEEPYIAQRPGIRERPVGTQVPEGELFLLGDNRNFSEDSRDIGTLPVENVLGRVVAVLFPRDRRRQLGDVEIETRRLW